MSADSPGNTEATGVCYLCGQQLEDPINRDHIPPSLFFADSIRQRCNLSQLLTARVHQGVRYPVLEVGPAIAHARQDKELVLEFEGLNRFLST